MSKPTRSLMTDGSFQRLQRLFLAEVRARKQGRPLSPILVLVPTNLLRVHLMRFLADEGCDHLNVRFVTFADLSRELGRPILAAKGRAQVSEMAAELIVAEICERTGGSEQRSEVRGQRSEGGKRKAEGSDGPNPKSEIQNPKSASGGDHSPLTTHHSPTHYFSAISDRPGFHRALLATIADLKEACLTPQEFERAVRRCATRPPTASRHPSPVTRHPAPSKLDSLLALWTAYEARLAELRLHDEADLMLAAAESAKDSWFLAQQRALLIYGFYDFNAAQRRLLAACAERVDTVAFVPYEDSPAFEYARPTVEWFRATGFTERGNGQVSGDRCQVTGDGRGEPGLSALATQLFCGAGGKQMNQSASEAVPAPAHPQTRPPANSPTRHLVRIVSAPGEAREVREIAREVVRVVRGSDCTTENTDAKGDRGRGLTRIDADRSGTAVRRNSVPDSRSSAFIRVQDIPSSVSSVVNTSLPRVGILLRNPGAYGRLMADMCQWLEWKPYLHEGVALADTRAGRSLLLLLGILGSNYGRKEVMEFVTYAPLELQRFAGKDGTDTHILECSLQAAVSSPAGQANPPQADCTPDEEHSAPPSASLWDTLSQQAGIVDGRDEWQKRLERLKASWESERAEASEDERQAARGRPEAIAGLMTFVGELFSALDRVAKAATWAEQVDALRAAFTGLVGECDGLEQVRETLNELRQLEALKATADLPLLRRLTADALASESLKLGEFEVNGPTVAGLMAARGVPFDVVIVPGMVEKSFPQPASQDPILLDHEREALNAALGAEVLPLKRRKLLEERLLFRLAVGAARRQVILTFPRIETGTARERLPSSFLLRTVQAVTAERADFQALEKFEGFQRVPLSRWEPGGLDEAVDSLEFDLAAVTDLTARREANGILYLREVSPFFGRGLKEELMRWGKAHFTEYDGALQSPKALELVRQRHSVRGRTVSPSRLETYAGCPFGYFLQYVLGLESAEEPEKAATISALDKGSLIHEALWQFFTELSRAGRLPVKEEHEADLMRALEDRFRKYEASGLTGFWLLWQIEKERIGRDLRWFLQVEADEAEKGYVPRYFEVRYGMARRDGMESEISSELGPSLPFSPPTRGDNGMIPDFQKSGMMPGPRQQDDNAIIRDSQKSGMPSKPRSGADRGIIADFQKSAIMLGAHPQGQRPDEVTGGPPAIVRFRGRIDRIDLTAEGKSARVIDYKTGKKPPGAGDGKFGGGTQLQLPIYLLAAQELLPRHHPGVRVAEAQYFHMTEKGGMARVPFTSQHWDAKLESLRQIVSIIDAGISAGLFFQRPEEQDTCKFCDFKQVCGAGVDALFAKKRNDGKAATVMGLEKFE